MLKRKRTTEESDDIGRNNILYKIFGSDTEKTKLTLSSPYYTTNSIMDAISTYEKICREYMFKNIFLIADYGDHTSKSSASFDDVRMNFLIIGEFHIKNSTEIYRKDFIRFSRYDSSMVGVLNNNLFAAKQIDNSIRSGDPVKYEIVIGKKPKFDVNDIAEFQRVIVDIPLYSHRMNDEKRKYRHCSKYNIDTSEWLCIQEEKRVAYTAAINE